MQVNMRHLALAQRLTFTPDGTSRWSSESGWRMRMLFAWQRLVRAPKVAVHRKGSDMWQEGERTRVTELAQSYKAELSREEDWMDKRNTPRGQRYHWDSEATLQTQHGVSSGAAAVLERRRTQHNEQETSRLASGPQHGSDNHKRGHSECEVAEGGQSAAMNTRRGDGLLVYNAQSLRRLEVQLTPERQREPFGDG